VKTLIICRNIYYFHRSCPKK